MLGLSIVLLLIGLGIIVLEVLFPSFGLFTIVSGACVVGSVFAAFQHGTTAGLAMAVCAVVLVPVSIMTGFRLLRTTSLGNRLLLGAPDTPADVEAIYENNNRLVGMRGVAVTPLRPAGTVEIDGERIPVVSEGDLVDTGATVEVIEVEGNRIAVRPFEPHEENETPADAPSA